MSPCTAPSAVGTDAPQGVPVCGFVDSLGPRWWGGWRGTEQPSPHRLPGGLTGPSGGEGFLSNYSHQALAHGWSSVGGVSGGINIQEEAALLSTGYLSTIYYK